MEKKLVSVCVGTYQHSGYIRECIEGLLSQKTNFPFEIIIGEDQSTDGTREICIEYAAKYPEIIRLFLRDRKDVIYVDGKATGRFNFIQNLKACTGKYIALCDGDDYWIDDKKLQKQIDILEANPDFSICFHPVKITYADRPQDSHISNAGQKTISTIEDLAFGNVINTASCIFRNNIINTLPSWMLELPAADWSLHLLNAQYGNVYYIDEPMAVYRINSGSVWGNQPKKAMFKKIIHMLTVFEENFDAKYTVFFKRAKSSWYMNTSDYYKGNNDKVKEFFYFYKACKSSDFYKMGYKDLIHKLKEIIIR